MENFVFKKKFGQNFISDKNLLGAICADAGVQKQDNVLEIGAGAGSLTQELSARAKKVVAFEIDQTLRQPLEDLHLANVQFVFSDFMKFPAADVASLFDDQPFKVVANLPYYITTPIIFKLLENAANLRIQSITIMVQKEVAQRVCADVGGKDYGVLSVATALYGTPKITRIIGRQMFFPVPNVDSALLHIVVEEKFPTLNKEKFMQFVKTCFSMRRKTLLNNLSCYAPKETLKNILGEQILAQRAEKLPLETLLKIFEKLQAAKILN